MSTLIKAQDVRTIAVGINVSRAAAALPSTTIGSLFTITGGRVLLKALHGQVVTLLSGTNSTTVGLTPLNTGTSSPAILSSAGIIPVAAGSPVVSKFDGGALIVTVTGSLIAAAGYVTIPGDITITTGSTVTGTVKWDLLYVPLDVGAAVVAA
jgi:hypothetical protein